MPTPPIGGKYGLVVSNKKKPTTLNRSSVFTEDDEAQEQQSVPVAPVQLVPSVVSRQAKRHVQELQEKALAEDETIFDYDGVFDQIKETERKERMRREGVSRQRDARYIHAMLQQAEERQKQTIRMQERKIQRELEQDLAAHPDLHQAEVFVTEAYKRQQEEIRLLEEAEKLRELQAAQHRPNVVGFYKELLTRREQTADALRQVQLEVKVTKEDKEQQEEEDREKEKEREMLEKPRLVGGLNRLNPAARTQKERFKEHQDARGGSRGGSIPGGKSSTSWKDKQQRDRLAHVFEEQLEERQKEELKRQREEEQALKQKWARQTKEDAVEAAKQRALERQAARKLEPE